MAAALFFAERNVSYTDGPNPWIFKGLPNNSTVRGTTKYPHPIITDMSELFPKNTNAKILSSDVDIRNYTRELISATKSKVNLTDTRST